MATERSRRQSDPPVRTSSCLLWKAMVSAGQCLRRAHRLPGVGPCHKSLGQNAEERSECLEESNASKHLKLCELECPKAIATRWYAEAKDIVS